MRIVSYRIVSYRILSYPIVSYRIVSYRIVPYRIVSYRIVSSRLVSIVSYHIVAYCSVSYRIVSYRIVSYHIVSYRIVSYRIVSYLIISYRIVSYRIVSYRSVSYRILSYRIVSYRIPSYRIYRIVSYRIVSYHIVSYRIVSGFDLRTQKIFRGVWAADPAILGHLAVSVSFVLGNTPWELLRTAFDFPGMPPKRTAYLGLCAACGVGWRVMKSSSGHVSGCAIPEQSITEWQSLGLLPYRSQNLANSKLCKGCLLALPKIAAHAQKARMFRDSLATVLTSAVREKRLLEQKAAEASTWKASAEEATSSYHYLQEAYLSQREECKQLDAPLNQEAEQAQRDHAAELTALQDQNTQLVEEKTQLLEENTKLQQQTEDGDKLYSPTQSQHLSSSQGSDYIPTPLRATAGKKVSTSGKTTAYTYSPAVIRAAWGLLTADMPTSRVPEVLQLLLQCSPATAGADGLTVPAIPTIIRWLHALGLCVTQLQTAYEIAQSESCTLHSDGTSKNLVNQCPSGVCYTQPSGTAEDSAKGIKSALEAAAEECRLAGEYDESLFNLFGDVKACQLLAAPACYMSDNEAAAQATGKEWLDMQRAASSENELPDIERLLSDWIKQQIGEAADLNEIIGKKDNIQCVALRELAKFFSTTDKLWPFSHLRRFALWFKDPVSGKENATDTAMRRSKDKSA
eukprot:g73631.t1